MSKQLFAFVCGFAIGAIWVGVLWVVSRNRASHRSREQAAEQAARIRPTGCVYRAWRIGYGANINPDPTYPQPPASPAPPPRKP
jgi:hypothetical protein